jgi:hypothetical protein
MKIQCESTELLVLENPSRKLGFNPEQKLQAFRLELLVLMNELDRCQGLFSSNSIRKTC